MFGLLMCICSFFAGFLLFISLSQSKARRNTHSQRRVPDRDVSGSGGPDRSWNTHSVWHHAASLRVSGPEQSRREVSGQQQQDVCVGGRVCEGRAGTTYMWLLPISWKLCSQSSSSKFQEAECFRVAHCRTLIVFFIYLFWCVYVCSCSSWQTHKSIWRNRRWVFNRKRRWASSSRKKAPLMDRFSFSALSHAHVYNAYVSART